MTVEQMQKLFGKKAAQQMLKDMVAAGWKVCEACGGVVWGELWKSHQKACRGK